MPRGSLRKRLQQREIARGWNSINFSSYLKGNCLWLMIRTSWYPICRLMIIFIELSVLKFFCSKLANDQHLLQCVIKNSKTTSSNAWVVDFNYLHMCGNWLPATLLRSVFIANLIFEQIQIKHFYLLLLGCRTIFWMKLCGVLISSKQDLYRIITAEHDKPITPVGPPNKYSIF